jgi:hypothetical protein
MGFLLSILSGLISIIDKLVPDRKTRDFGKIMQEADKDRDAVSYWIRNRGMRDNSTESGDKS